MSVVKRISEKYKAVYLAGDMNLDLLRIGEANYYRQQLLQKWIEFIEEQGIQWSKTGPTFESDGLFDGEHRTAILDHIYTRSCHEVVCRVLPDKTSDHRPVLAHVKRPPIKQPRRVTRVERNWKGMNKAALEMFLLQWDWDKLMATKDVDSAVAMLEEAVTAALDVSVPVKVFTTPNMDVRLRQDTLRAMRARDTAKKEGKLCYKLLRNKALSLVRRDHVQHNVDRIRKHGASEAWRIVRETSGVQKGSRLPIPANCETDQEAANLVNDYYIEKVKKLRDKLDCQTPLRARALQEGTFRFSCIGTATLKSALQKLQAKTAVGTDGVPITIFKSAWAPLALPLVHIVNLIIKTGEWPREWKEAVITPVLKTGKPPSEASSYRPVALLCSVSKLTERVLYDQLSSHVETHGLLPDGQHGYRRGRSVDTALARVMSQVAKALDHGKRVGISAFDFSAAFDTVEAAVLESKLPWAGEQARKLIMNYLHGGKQRVSWNGCISSSRFLEYGVRQGSVLGPLLFILLTADLPMIVTSGCEPVTQTTVSLYADDTSSVTASETWEEVESEMSRVAANLEEYSKSNGLCLNMGKTQTLKLGCAKEATTATLKILGVEVDRTVGFSNHHATMLVDLRRRVGVVRRLATKLSRGRLLNEIARSLVIGKVQCNAWVTRRARLNPLQPQTGEDVATQRTLTELARTLMGVRRSDRVRVVDLVERMNCSLNELVVKQAAVAAWKAVNGGALHDLLHPYDERTRGHLRNLRRASSNRCLAAVNMADVWNASEQLRSATTLTQAKTAAKKFASSVRHI